MSARCLLLISCPCHKATNLALGATTTKPRFGILPVDWIRRAFCRHGGLFFLVSRRVEIIK